jgi:hypothetical protein
MSALVLVAALVTVPPGWIDLAGDVPATNFDGISDTLLRQARSGKFARFAVTPDHSASMMVQDSPDLGYIDDKVLEVVANNMPRSTIVERAIVRVRHRRVGRVVAVTHGEETDVRSITYLVSEDGRSVGISYFAPEQSFAKHKDEFEAAAAATIAAVDPAWWAVGRDELLVGGLILAAISIVIASVLNRRTVR